MTEFQQKENRTGWRPVFNQIPYSKNMAHKAILPLGFFYTPFLGEPNYLKASPLYCSKCKSVVNTYSMKNTISKRWTCRFCGIDNPYLIEVGTSQVEQYIEGKAGDTGVYFIIDLCLPQNQLNSIKETIIKTIQKMPRNIYVGLLAFNRNLMMLDFSEQEEPRFICLSGNYDYSTDKYQTMKKALNLVSNVDPRHASKVILKKFYVPIDKYQNCLINAINGLQVDSFHQPRQLRQKRAVGSALQVALNTISSIGINTRFILLLGGPSTIGPGKVVDLPIKKTIRVYMDIFENTENAQFVASATKFYSNLKTILIEQKNTLDIWAYGLDQFGLLQMKDMVNSSGGMLAMHQLFDHFIFQVSFEKFYEANEDGMFKFAIAAHINLRISKQMRINGIIGTCKSLQDNSEKIAAQMQIGQGGTQAWYIGGITDTNSLCIFISNNDQAGYQNKEKVMLLQAITTYKYSDNIIRTRVSTICLNYLRDAQIRQMIKGFDQQAAAVMLARYATKKSEIEDVTQVKKWLDRLLLKFTVKFGYYTKGNANSFRLPNQMKHFPQFLYHLRRSGFINPFGSPPDQSIYIKTCMQRQIIGNCMAMIQPVLLKYTIQNPQPEPVELDFRQLQDQVVLLLDTYFNVLIWYGEHIKGWKDQKMNQDPQYAYLNDLFTTPLQDASDIMYDRLPVSNFYETFKYDGKQRYLKSRVNPSKNSQQTDGHFVSDDASIKVFMNFLIRSVINYND